MRFLILLAIIYLLNSTCSPAGIVYKEGKEAIEVRLTTGTVVALDTITRAYSTPKIWIYLIDYDSVLYVVPDQPLGLNIHKGDHLTILLPR